MDQSVIDRLRKLMEFEVASSEPPEGFPSLPDGRTQYREILAAIQATVSHLQF